MLRDTTIPLDRAWNTWSSRAAEMVFLPLGVRITPVLYANSVRRASSFEAGDPGLTLGRHATDGSLIELGLELGGTRLAWSYRKPDPFSLVGAWRTDFNGEWGLRFWVNLCLSCEGGESARFDPAAQAAVLRVGHRYLALASDTDPVLVTGHPSMAALLGEYEEKGYFYLGSRRETAPLLALRFNLEMMRDGRFAVGMADREDLAVSRAKTALGAPGSGMDAPAALPMQSGRFARALDAVRDVIAWNTVWDEVNARPYTSISRNWNLSKFGGYGVWLNDQQYAGLLAGTIDAELARQNLAAWLAGATPQGNLACLLTANDSWVDRTQLPIGAFLVWLLYLRTRSRPLLDLTYDILARNHDWWWENRDLERRGLVSYGTSDVGEGLYKGTHFGARNESSMDNSPIHDEAEYDPHSRTLTTIDVGLNSLLALDAEMLARMAHELGRTDQARGYEGTARTLRQRIQTELWDEARGLFANRLRAGAFVKSVGPTSFYPLLCGAATEAQTERLLKHLDDPQKFGGAFVIPGTARDDPAAKDNSYWRGRIWPPLNYLVWQGLRRGEHTERASALAKASFELFRSAWEERRLSPENFNAETGKPLDQPDTEGFYNWGALMPLMAVGEIMDFSAWHGWELTNTGDELTLGPVLSPVGAVVVTVANGKLELTRGGQALFATDMVGRFSHLDLAETDASFVLPPALSTGQAVWLPQAHTSRILYARCGEAELQWEPDGDGIVLAFSAKDAGKRVWLHWNGD